MCEAYWAVAYHANSHSPRAKKWYRVSRLVNVDGKFFELYWHPDLNLRGNSWAKIKKLAQNAGVQVLPGLFCDAPSPRQGSEMIRCGFNNPSIY